MHEATGTHRLDVDSGREHDPGHVSHPWGNTVPRPQSSSHPRKDDCPACIAEGRMPPKQQHCKIHQWTYQEWVEPWRQSIRA